MKVLISLSLFVVITFSCSRNGNTNSASIICNCYDEIHSASVQLDNEKSIEAKVNACNTMLSDQLSSFGEDEDKKADFLTDFRACQEN